MERAYRCLLCSCLKILVHLLMLALTSNMWNLIALTTISSHTMMIFDIHLITQTSDMPIVIFAGSFEGKF